MEILFLTTRLLDIYQTLIGVYFLGFNEGNPLQKLLLKHPFLFIFYQLFFSFLLLKHYKKNKYLNFAFKLFVPVSFLLVLWNFFWLCIKN